MIEEKHQTKIPLLHRRIGEKAFRLLEEELIASLEGVENSVISLGGGAILSPLNRSLLRKLGVVIYLTSTEEDLIETLLSRRPFPSYLNPHAPEESIKELFRCRDPLYRELADETFSVCRFHVEPLREETLAEALSFLHRYEDFSLFLLGNLEAYGYRIGESPNSGQFKIVRSFGEVVAIFCLAKRGNLIVQSKCSEKALMEAILTSSEEEKIPIQGLLGEWDFCQPFWKLMKEKKVIEKEGLVAKSTLYVLETLASSGDSSVRLLQKEDYEAWKPLRIDYLKEEGLIQDLSDELLYQLFLEKVDAQISWGCFIDGRLVSMAELNAKTEKMGQVGGVYTIPSERRKGLARRVMQEIMREVQERHALRKLIIFTDEKNQPARGLYESLGSSFRGYYALLFKGET